MNMMNFTVGYLLGSQNHNGVVISDGSNGVRREERRKISDKILKYVKNNGSITHNEAKRITKSDSKIITTCLNILCIKGILMNRIEEKDGIPVKVYLLAKNKTTEI